MLIFFITVWCINALCRVNGKRLLWAESDGNPRYDAQIFAANSLFCNLYLLFY